MWIFPKKIWATTFLTSNTLRRKPNRLHILIKKKIFEQPNSILLSSKCLANRRNIRYSKIEKEIGRICFKCTMELCSTVKKSHEFEKLSQTDRTGKYNVEWGILGLDRKKYEISHYVNLIFKHFRFCIQWSL